MQLKKFNDRLNFHDNIHFAANTRKVIIIKRSELKIYIMIVSEDTVFKYNYHFIKQRKIYENL